MATRRIRRCHVCGAVIDTEQVAGAEKIAQRCHCCGKHLAPFYFFDESELTGFGDDKLHLSLWKMRSGYSPIWGIFALWSDEDTHSVDPADS